MSRTLANLPAQVRKRLEAALRLGVLAPPYTAVAVRSALGRAEDSEAIAAALRADTDAGGSAGERAAWLRGFEAMERRVPVPDLVWSGPKVPGLHTRDTRRVHEELLGNAERSIWAATYVVDGPRAFGTLAKRMDERPRLEATLLLNIERGRGDTTAPEPLVRRFAERFWRKEWPGARRPRVFYDPRPLGPKGATGVLHAKAVVVDDERVFVTSANLTRGGAGPQHRDRAAGPGPGRSRSGVTSHFRGLIERKPAGSPAAGVGGGTALPRSGGPGGRPTAKRRWSRSGLPGGTGAATAPPLRGGSAPRPARPHREVIKERVEEGQDDQREHGRGGEAADHRAGEGEVVEPVEARCGRCHRDQRQHGGAGGHQDGPQPVAARRPASASARSSRRGAACSHGQ